MINNPEVMDTLIPHFAGGIIKRDKPASQRDLTGLVPAAIFSSYLGLLRFRYHPILEGPVEGRIFRLSIGLDSFVAENDCGIKLELIQDLKLKTTFLFYPELLKRMNNGQLSRVMQGDTADLRGLARFLRKQYR